MRELSSLAAARIAFGIVFLFRTTPVLWSLEPRFMAGTWPLLGWPDGAPRFAVLGIEPPAAIVGALCIVRTAAALALCLGIRARWAGVAAGVAGYLVLAQDAFGYYHHLHLLFAGAILLGLTDSGARWALLPDRPRAPASSLRLLRAFVASIYGWAAIGKLRADWLDGRTLSAFYERDALRGPVADWLASTQSGFVVVAITVPIVEAALCVLLLVPRTRIAAAALAIVLHVAFEVVGRVDTIGWQMAALLPVFLTQRSARPRTATQSSTARTSRR